jgi:hypothetical protein
MPAREPVPRRWDTPLLSLAVWRVRLPRIEDFYAPEFGWMALPIAGLLLSAIFALFYIAPRAPRSEDSDWGPRGGTEEISLLDV